MLTSGVVVFVEGDFTKAESGAQRRIFEQIFFFISYGISVTVYSYYENFLNPWTEESVARFSHLFPGVKLVLEHQTQKLKLMMRFKNLAIILSPKSAEKILNWRLKRSTPKYDELTQTMDGSLLWCNYVDGMTLLNGVRNSRVVVDTHDIKFILVARRLNTQIYHARILLKLRRELVVLSRATALISISFFEKAFFSLMLPTATQFYIPSFQTNTRDTKKVQKNNESYKYDLIFVGSSNEFNQLGIAEFCKSNQKWLKNRRIAIAGRVGEEGSVMGLKEFLPNLDILGFVDDLSSLYSQAKAALSPVSGAGLKIKVLEALSAGKPVFASVHSIEGLPPGYENCVFPTEQASIEALLDDPVLLARAELAARVYSCAIVEVGEQAKLIDFLNTILNSGRGKATLEAKA